MKSAFFDKKIIKRGLVFRGDDIYLSPYYKKHYSHWKRGFLNKNSSEGPFDVLTPKHSSLEKSFYHKKLKEYDKGIREKSYFKWAILLRSNHQHLGEIDLSILDNYHGWANLGYHVHPSYRGHGVATKSIKILFSAVFKEMGLHRIEVVIDKKNKISNKIAKRLELTFEGSRKNIFCNDRGKIYNVFSVTNTEKNRQ